MKNKVIILFILLFAILVNMSVSAQTLAGRYANTSVLAEGKWVKIRIKDNGIYRLSYDDLKKMGFNDPAKIKIYGYGGWKLDEVFTNPYQDDLPEVPVWKSSVSGFKSGDYLLFYGKGTTKWSYISSAFAHENNPYDMYGYYFITEDDRGPLLMTEEENYSGETKEVAVFDDYIVHERDEVALLNSGRELFGESFSMNRFQNFSFIVPGITKDPLSVSLSFAAGHHSTGVAVFASIDGNKLIEKAIPGLGNDSYIKANLITATGTLDEDNKSENFSVKIDYSGTSGIAYLNFIALNYKRTLRFYNQAYTFFRHRDSRSSGLKYMISNAGNNCYVWNITDPLNVKKVNVIVQGSQFSFSAAPSSVISEYVMIDTGKSFPTPEVVGVIDNQNLHGLEQVDMIIISPEAYFSYAEQLAQKHRERQGFVVKVVQDDWIYNEFSSGTRDATAYRRFLKMFYDRSRGGMEGPELKYLLLYGDGYFDNRHLSREGKNLNPDNYLLTYQFKNSTDEKYSYGTDDYFGFLDDSEGGALQSDQLDVGIGRFPVNTVEQAKNAMDKTVGYMENSNYGNWRNTVIFTADDTGTDAFVTHAKDAERLAVYLENNRPEITVSKSYMDAFQSVDANGKKTYPGAKNKFLNTLKEGSLLTNYAGHGSPSTLSAEDMINISDIRQMNFPNLPLWITATCDFGWFDSNITSAGEEVFLNKQSGGIALYTTTRVVYADSNSDLNIRIIQQLFPVSGDRYPTLGDAFRKAKNGMNSSFNKLNFVLLGDPALVLNYPKEEVVIERILINGKEQSVMDVLNFRALDKITVEGKIVNPQGEKIEDFNGNLQVDVFDAKQSVKSIAVQNGVPWTFDEFQNKIYTGTNKIGAGNFSFSFTVPLDISYNPFSTGKMTMYAWDEEKSTDAVGYSLKYTLSGSNDEVNLNTDGPVIESMYLNSELFKEGDVVHETPFFYAKVSDEDGINMSGNGIGHDITVSIDNNPAWTYNLNSYYQAIDAISGTIGFAIPELPAGEHTLTFKVWDILNNSTSDDLSFIVRVGATPEIYDVEVWPNPVITYAEFRINHNRPETVLDVKVNVFDLSGRLVWSQGQTGSNIYSIKWELGDPAGQRVQPGVYLYQAVVKSDGGKEVTKAKKIIVKGQ